MADIENLFSNLASLQLNNYRAVRTLMLRHQKFIACMHAYVAVLCVSCGRTAKSQGVIF